MIVENDEKKHCPYCQSGDVKLNGKTKDGKQRYRCLKCEKTYLWRSLKPLEERRYKWFKEWIEEGYTVKQLSGIHKVSKSTIQRVLCYWLKKNTPEEVSFKEIKNIILDGTYINHRTGIYVIMNSENHKIIYGNYGIREGKDLKDVYEGLQLEGLDPIIATIDGSLQQLKYLRTVWSNLIIQRCLVHIQRQGLSWLRKKPKRAEAVELRDILLKVLSIKSKEEAKNFINGFKQWETRYGYQLSRSTNRGKVFSDLLRARSMIINALSDMFIYLDYPGISKTTNPLEGYFGRLKQKYRAHRGLSKKKRKNFFKWYFYLKPL